MVILWSPGGKGGDTGWRGREQEVRLLIRSSQHKTHPPNLNEPSGHRTNHSLVAEVVNDAAEEGDHLFFVGRGQILLETSTFWALDGKR